MVEMDAKTLLEGLGLTEYEAKTLDALFRLAEAEAPEISRRAQVPKTRVYDVLDRLTKKGLIIEIYGRPKKYKVVEAGSVFSKLIEEKKAELAGLEHSAERIRGMLSGSAAEDTCERVMKVKDRSDFMRILGQEIDTARNSVVVLADLRKEHNIIKTHVKNALDRNIELRLISRISEESKRLAKEFSDYGVKMRECEHGMHAYVIDGKKVVLSLSDFSQERPEYHFTIWPENRPLAEAITNYFNECWKKGK